MDAGNVPASISLTLRIDLPQNEVLHGNLWNPPYPAIPVCFELACAQQFIHGVVADSNADEEYAETNNKMRTILEAL